MTFIIGMFAIVVLQLWSRFFLPIFNFFVHFKMQAGAVCRLVWPASTRVARGPQFCQPTYWRGFVKILISSACKFRIKISSFVHWSCDSVLIYFSGVGGCGAHYLSFDRYKKIKKWGFSQSIPPTLSWYTHQLCTSHGMLTDYIRGNGFNFNWLGKFWLLIIGSIYLTHSIPQKDTFQII